MQKDLNDEVNEEQKDVVPLFGMLWNKRDDTLGPHAPRLSLEANTKRTVLSSLNSIYDIYNLYVPILIRARVFMQSLQEDSLPWDSKLPEDLLREWINIAKQVNSCPAINVNRCVGDRTGTYALYACCDASRVAVGCVVYIENITTKKVSYLTSQSRLLNKVLKQKPIPTLECYALYLGAKALIDILESLAGPSVVSPVNIVNLHVFTDSMVCLHWLQALAFGFEKMQRVSILVKNKLKQIDELSQKKSITFHHISGSNNTADYCTRPTSYRLLSETKFYEGPSVIRDSVASKSDLTITLPNPHVRPGNEIPSEEWISCSSATAGTPNHSDIQKA